LQNTSEENVVTSDLEYIVGGTDSPRQPEASGRGRYFALLAGTLLTVAAMTLCAVGGRTAHVSKASSTVGLSSSEWKQVLGDAAYAQLKDSEKELGEEVPKLSTFDSPLGKPKEEVSVKSQERRSSLRAASSSATTVAPAPKAATVQLSATTVAPAPKAATVQLKSSSSNLTALAQEMLAEAQKHEPSSADGKALSNVAKMILDADSSAQSEASAALTSTPNPAASALAPTESLEDGNKCPSDEEEYPKTGGTCFKKCSDLTGGAYPIRSSAFSCCQQEPCHVGNSKIHLSFCGGFDVAGDSEGSGCPAGEGACLQDEEMLGGICYKKCSLFDEGSVYFHRVAPNMCCSTRGFRCLLPKFTKFSVDFAAGGGKGDGNQATPATPHAPMQELTEATV